MTEIEYRSYPAISRSELWRMSETPEKFKYYREHPPEPTPALLFGQVVHKLLLQPGSFDEEFAIAPSVDRRTKDGREIYNAFLTISVGKIIVPPDMYETAKRMADAALQVPFVQKLLNGQREVPFFWTDEDTGIDCKCRVDCLSEIGENLVIVDYKSCTDASNDGFMRDAIKFGYTLQSAMYSEGVQHSTGRKPLFVFIVQEKTAPFSVNILQADEALIKYGYDIFREYIGMYKYCTETGNWYGYLGRAGMLNSLSLPAWLAKERG